MKKFRHFGRLLSDLNLALLGAAAVASYHNDCGMYPVFILGIVVITIVSQIDVSSENAAIKELQKK